MKVRILDRSPLLAMAIISSLLFWPTVSAAQLAGQSVPPINVLYPADFEAYAPVTALDALDRLPGLEIVNPADQRGLGAGGNVLINGERSGGKSNTVLDQLDRLAASAVVRVEIYAAATASFDAGGSSQVINVVVDQADGTVSGTFGGNIEMSVRTEEAYGDVNVSANWSKGPLTVDLAFETNGDVTPFFGIERFGPLRAQPDIVRDERRASEFRDLRVTGALGYTFSPSSVLRFNAQMGWEDRDTFERTTDLFSLGGAALEDTLLNIAAEGFDAEFTAEYERKVGEDLQLKFTALQSLINTRDALDFRDFLSRNDVTQLGNANDTRETILRGRGVSQASASHLLTFQLEGAYNKLDANLFFRQVPFQSALAPIRTADALSSNTVVQEYRGDGFIEDQWSLTPKLVLTTRLAAEISRLSVSGSSTNSRTLFFPKPQLQLAYQVLPKHRLELNFERLISQLEFLDFAANVSLADADQRGSTGALQPRKEWRTDVTWEMQLPRRAGRTAVILYHNLVQDAIEPVPLTPDPFEMVDTIGNIGTGNRFGIIAEVSVRLKQFDLPDILLEGGLTAQTTSIEDPITGLNRRLRNNSPLIWNASYRHDIPKWKVSYGGEISFGGRDRAFEINQLIDERQGPGGAVFVESQQIDGLVIQLRVINVLNRNQARQRTIFDPNRIIDPLPDVEDRSRRIGRYVRFSVEGVF